MQPSALSDVSQAAATRLRAYRRLRRMSLDEVSARIGISPSTLSRMESGQRRITLELLIPLAKVYETSLDELVSEEPLGDPRVHLRALARGPMTILPLARRAGGVSAFKVVLRPGAANPDTEHRSHEGWQWLLVLEGRLSLMLNNRRFDLGPGEAAEFDTELPHRFAAAGSQPVEYLVVYGPQGEKVALRASTRDLQNAGWRTFPTD